MGVTLVWPKRVGKHSETNGMDVAFSRLLAIVIEPVEKRREEPRASLSFNLRDLSLAKPITNHIPLDDGLLGTRFDEERSETR
jgi:hypothetical protein